MVPTYGDTEKYPLHLPDSRIVRLDNEGNYIDIEGESWQELK